MKAVMLSIQPEYCQRIATGIKTIEIRKNRPNMETPFKCYIYCTKGTINGKTLHTSNKNGVLYTWDNPEDCEIMVQPDNYTYMAYSCRGKVIGEFVCDKITMLDIENSQYLSQACDDIDSILNDSCLTAYELLDYASYNGVEREYSDIYAWHISNLKIYGVPRELSDFQKVCDHNGDCGTCKRFDRKNYGCICGLTRHPQSWCYVEEG